MKVSRFLLSKQQPLQQRSEVDQHVAAEREIQVREGRVSGYVMAGEHAQVSYLFGDPMATIHGHEEPRQSLGRHSRNRGLRILSRSGDRERGFAQVAREELQENVLPRRRRAFHQPLSMPALLCHFDHSQGIESVERSTQKRTVRDRYER